MVFFRVEFMCYITVTHIEPSLAYRRRWIFVLFFNTLGGICLKKKNNTNL